MLLKKEILENNRTLKEKNKELKKEIERLNNIINELEKDIDNQITFCTNEANGTTNDKYCRIALNYLKHLKDKLLELKGSNEAIPPEVIGTNGEDGGLFDYGDR